MQGYSTECFHKTETTSCTSDWVKRNHNILDRTTLESLFYKKQIAKLWRMAGFLLSQKCLTIHSNSRATNWKTSTVFEKQRLTITRKTEKKKTKLVVFCKNSKTPSCKTAKHKRAAKWQNTFKKSVYKKIESSFGPIFAFSSALRTSEKAKKMWLKNWNCCKNSSFFELPDYLYMKTIRGSINIMLVNKWSGAGPR